MLMASLFTKLFTLLVAYVFAGSALEFTYNGFRSANLTLDGISELTSKGLLMLTNDTITEVGHAFFPDPINFKNSSNGEVFSFSATFVFAIRSELKTSSTGGLAFVIAPKNGLPLQGSSMGFLGLFNTSTNGSTTNHVFAVELDTLKNSDFNDIDGNHVAIDINSISSVKQETAGYYDKGSFNILKLTSGEPMQLWVDYDDNKKEINATLAPFKVAKPSVPLLNLIYDLSPILNQTMYVGFSSSTGPVVTDHYVLGWSFKAPGGEAPELDLSQLPNLPRIGRKRVSRFFLTIGLPPICIFTISAAICKTIHYLRRKREFAEVLEDWEIEYGPHRFKYRDLYTATKGFKDTEFLGAGGFGGVYKGTSPESKLQIAVKRISHESRQGMREFVAEIVSIGQMSHRNLVPLLGYCRRKNELLLVYEYMPNGSLDKFLHDPEILTLNWEQRFRIIKGVASGLLYLHDGWERVVVHRDIKASNVLLDSEFNGRLGDFGLAKLYDHGTDPNTTHVVGTVGYLAPEHYTTGRATTSTDVYAFGVFLLEVVCGRRPIELQQSISQDLLLVERVLSWWKEGRILDAVDKKLGNDLMNEEAELVLKLGLLCCNPEPAGRPNMQKVMLYLDGSMASPELSSAGISDENAYGKGFDDVWMLFTSRSYPSTSTGNASSQFSNAEKSILAGDL